jgi:hypothetical protein
LKINRIVFDPDHPAYPGEIFQWPIQNSEDPKISGPGFAGPVPAAGR